MHPKDADVMAHSVDPDQTASSEAVWSWSALFAETYLSQYIEFVRYSKKLYLTDQVVLLSGSLGKEKRTIIKNLKSGHQKLIHITFLKMQLLSFYSAVLHPKDSDGKAHS